RCSDGWLNQVTWDGARSRCKTLWQCRRPCGPRLDWLGSRRRMTSGGSAPIRPSHLALGTGKVWWSMNDTPTICGTPSTAELDALRAIVEGTAGHTGDEFFRSLVRHLAAAVGTRYAFVAVFAAGTKARTLAFWSRDRIGENIEWDVVGTPCEDVVRGNLCHYPDGVSRRFPNDLVSVERGIESYLGVPLVDTQGKHLGHLAVFDDRPMPAEPRKLFIFQIFATRAAAELERLQYEERLRESEQRWRSLIEALPQLVWTATPDGSMDYGSA